MKKNYSGLIESPFSPFSDAVKTVLDGRFCNRCNKPIPWAFDVVDKIDWKTGKKIPAKATEETHCFCPSIFDFEE